MANEFIIRNGFQSRGDSQVTGSLDVTGGITGSYTGSFTGDGSGLTGISVTTGAFGIADASGSYTYYSDFQTAINAASAGETVEMFADVTETSAVTVTLKNGVNINGNGRTYELNTADATPAFITPNSTANFDIAIQNMIITRSNSTTTAGYCIGIGINTTGDLDLTGTIVNNTGAGYGITAVSANGNMQINNATVYTNSATAIFLNGNSQSGAKNCIAYSNSGIGIRNSNGKIINCFGQSTSGIGISNVGGDAINCTGVSGGTDGFQNQARAFRCTGISTGGAGYYSVNSGQNHNCTGYSSASYGFRTLGTGNHIVSNCSGYSTANAGMFLSQAVRANNCFAYSTVNNAYGGSGTANLYNCTGESLAAVTVTGVNDIYNCSLKCAWNDAGGHVINTTSVSLHEYFNNTLITTNASANAIYSLNAQTAYIGSNVYKGMTTPINANITNIQSNASDAYGNVLIG